MAEASTREPELLDPENGDGARLNAAASSSKQAAVASKAKDLPERDTWSSKLDFILSVVSSLMSLSLSLLVFFYLDSLNHIPPTFVLTYICTPMILYTTLTEPSGVSTT